MTDIREGDHTQQTTKNHVPRLFVIYVVFFSAVAISGTYLNLYFNSVGLSKQQIGAIMSISTAVTFFANILWGSVTDRAADKRRILRLLLVLAGTTALAFYLNTSFFYLLLAAVLFAVFFTPTTPLLDTYSLELLENTRTDYGQIRTGGTLGYSFTVLITGWFLDDAYQHIFWLVAISLFLCWILTVGIPKIENTRVSTGRTSFGSLPRDGFLIAILIYNFIFALGTSFYYSFYPIYFQDQLGGNSRLIGILMFVGAMTEVPIYIFAGRIIQKIGIKRLLLIASSVTILRWILLAFLTDPYLIILAAVLHGIGFTSFSYSVITYINRVMPSHMRARGQTFNVLFSQVLPRVVSGYVGGSLSELIGVNNVVLLNGIILAIATVLFLLVKNPTSKRKAEQLP